MTERASINQKIQVGAESSPGSNVSAGKLLENLTFVFGVKPDVKTYKPTGRKYVTVQEENKEWITGTVGGTMDYNDLPYLLSGAWGVITPGSHGSSSTAKDWSITPVVSGPVTPQTYTVEQGDTVRAHKSNYVFPSKIGYKFTREEATVSGDLLGQALQDGITLTSNPTAVALAPMVGKHFNIYLDSTSGGLGTTQLTKPLSFEFTQQNIFSLAWFINRSVTGFTSHVDEDPTTKIKMLLEADSNGMALLGYLQSGTTYFMRVDAQGNQIASDGPGAVYNEFKHDMAVKVTNVQPFSNSNGIYAIEWELDVVEDATWGKAQIATVTNLITAL